MKVQTLWERSQSAKRRITTGRSFHVAFWKSFHCNPLMMTINAASDGRCVAVNESFLRVTGYSRQEVIGYTLDDLKFKIGLEDEIRIQTKAGEVCIGTVFSEKIEMNGEPCVLHIIRDDSNFKRLEKELARLDQLNLVGEMAASIGHEIRNPMTTVRGFLQMLGDKHECRQYKEYFDLIIEELDRANTIVSEFLSMAQVKITNLKLRNLNSIIKSLMPLIHADALIRENDITLDLGDVPDLSLDDKEIRQMILNLCRNGLEAMASNGILEIKTYMEGSEVVLLIKDQGSGIPPEVQEKIGTPFFTTKENGTGLGLTVCYSIAKSHKAKITMDSGPVGTSIFIRFPNK